MIWNGETEDHVEAVMWYRIVADQGDREAQRYLSQCYLTGDGVPQDLDQSLRWFEKAVE